MRAYLKKDFFGGEDTVVVQDSPPPRSREICREHTHEFFEFVYVQQGTGYHTVDGRTYDIKRGSLLFINFGQTHAFSVHDCTYYNILLLPEFLGKGLASGVDAVYDLFSMMLESGERAKVDFSATEATVLDGLIQALLREYRERAEDYRSALSDLLHYLIILVLRKLREHPSETHVADEGNLREVLSYCREHFSENLSLTEVSERFFYNASYFSRRFKQFTGVGFTAYLNSLKVERAMTLLQTTDDSVEQIAAAVGFGDVKTLYVQLKRFTGCTPSQLRKT